MLLGSNSSAQRLSSGSQFCDKGASNWIEDVVFKNLKLVLCHPLFGLALPALHRIVQIIRRFKMDQNVGLITFPQLRYYLGIQVPCIDFVKVVVEHLDRFVQLLLRDVNYGATLGYSVNRSQRSR